MKTKNDDIKQSMDDTTKDSIVIVDSKGNTLGEIPRSSKEERGEQSREPKKDTKKEHKKEQRQEQKTDRTPNKDSYDERHKRANPKMKRRLSKRERRKQRRRAIIAIIAEIILGLAILIIGGGLFAFTMCSVENVEVEGNAIYSSQEIQEFTLDGKYSDNCVYDVIHNVIHPKKGIAFIDGIKVSMTGLNSLKITVTERVPFGYAVDEEANLAKYFDEDGAITDISELRLSQSTIWEGIIPTGENVGDVIYDDSVMLSSYLDTAKALKVYSIFVNSISIDEGHNIYATKDSIKINFGLKNDIDQKCKRLSIILPQLENQTGTLHLENFSSENTDIVFKKEN